MIRARTEPELKETVEKIFKELGITTTEAINIFYHQVKLQNGMPFEVKLPNKTTEKTFNRTDKGKNIVKCKDSQDLFRKLDS